MAVQIYEASSNRGNERVGDQTGTEVKVDRYRNDGWISLLRYVGDGGIEMCKKAASIGGLLCSSRLVGYSQKERYTLYNELKKRNWDVNKFLLSNVEVGTDCSAFAYTVWCCVCPELRIGNNGITVIPSTRDIVQTFRRSGKFIVNYDKNVLSNQKLMQIGDVLTSKGHSVSIYSTEKDTPTYVTVENIPEIKETEVLESHQTYNSPYQKQREKLSERIPATRCRSITTVGIQSNKSIESLFASPFYYLQNGYNNSVDIETPKEDRKYVKTLLYLHTLNWDYNKICTETKKVGFFNNRSATHGGVEMVPSGWVYLLGGLIWRSDYYITNKIDPIAFGYFKGGEDGNNNKEYVQLYKSTDSLLCPLLVKSDNNKTYSFGVITSNASGYREYAFEGKEFISDLMDVAVRNGLKKAFVNFVERFYPIIESLELKLNVQDNLNNPSRQEQSGITYADHESVVLGEAPIKTLDMTYSSCVSLISSLKDKALDVMLKVFSGRVGYKYDNQNIAMLKGFSGHYCMGFYAKKYNGIVLYYNENYKLAENLYNMTYGAPLIVTTNIVSPEMNYRRDQNVISDDNYRSYLAGFCDTLTYYTKNSTNIVSTGAIPEDLDVNSPEREFKSEIYMFLKNLWDRWFCGFYNNDGNEGLNSYFSVNTFFDNFIFMDSFYKNIGHKLRLNCNLLLNEYSGGDNSVNKSGKSLINHLGNVVAKHQCTLYNFADYVNFSGNKANDMLKQMFIPNPTNSVEPPKISNKFVVIYTHTANSLETNDRNKFNSDTFDIWSYNEGLGVAPSVFTYKSSNESENENEHPEYRMGYKVPAFGVAYSRQNNSYWKNIRVGTDTQTITEQAARSLAQIAEKGNSSKKKICFYGQDIYSIYQAYSYLVTIEMMGCAQIQPLMYFQLMNVPMFRGSYMVIKVEHTMRAGDMTTTFTGMKMSKVQKPFTTNWFTVVGDNNGPEISDNKDVANNGTPIRSSDGFELDIEDDKLSNAINKYIGQEMYCDVFVRNVFNELGVTINHNLILENNIGMYQELDNDSEWTTNLFKVRPRKSNNWKPLSNINTHPDVGELLFGYHNGVVDGDQLHHVGIYLGMHGGRHYVAEGGDRPGFESKTGVSNGKVRVSSIDTSMMSESDDVYIYHARSKKANIAQHKEEPKPKANGDDMNKYIADTTIIDYPSDGSQDVGMVSSHNRVVEIEIKNGFDFYTREPKSKKFPTPSDGFNCVTQCAASTWTKSPLTYIGCSVSENKVKYGADSFENNIGGIIIYNDGKHKFCLTGDEYIKEIENDIPIPYTIGDGSPTNTIRAAFQGHLWIYNGKEVYRRSGNNGVYRAIGMKNGRLYLIVSNGVQSFSKMTQNLKELEYDNAIYLESGSIPDYGWYKLRNRDEGKITKNVKDGVWYWKNGEMENIMLWTNFIAF